MSHFIFMQLIRYDILECWKCYSGQEDTFFFFHVFLKMINAWGKEIKVTGNCLQFPADGAKVRLIMYLRLLSHSAVTKL